MSLVRNWRVRGVKESGSQGIRESGNQGIRNFGGTYCNFSNYCRVSAGRRPGKQAHEKILPALSVEAVWCSRT